MYNLFSNLDLNQIDMRLLNIPHLQIHIKLCEPTNMSINFYIMLDFILKPNDIK